MQIPRVGNLWTPPGSLIFYDFDPVTPDEPCRGGILIHNHLLSKFKTFKPVSLDSSFKEECLLYFIVKSLFFLNILISNVFDSVSHFFLIKKERTPVLYLPHFRSLYNQACLMPGFPWDVKKIPEC